MRLEFTAEELQVFAIGYKAKKPFEVEDVFKGKPYSYVLERVNDIHKKYKEVGLLDSQEFQDLMMTFLFPRKVLSVVHYEEKCLVSIFYSALGKCAKCYDENKKIYELWTIETIEEENNTFLDFLKIGNITCNKKTKNIYPANYFKKHFLKESAAEKLDENDKKMLKIYRDCSKTDIILSQEGNEFGYDLEIVTQFFITNDGIEFAKAHCRKKTYIVECGITDTKGLIDIAFHQATPVPKKNKQKKIIFIIALIIALILLCCGIRYISNKNNLNNMYANKEYNVESINEDFIIEHESKYSIITDQKTNKTYIIKKNEKNEYEELTQTNESPYILGVYNERLYYSDDEEMAYINLKDKLYEKISCIRFKNAINEYVTGYPDFQIACIGSGCILNNSIYFTDGATPSSYLYKIDINETNLKNSVKVIDDDIPYDKWQIDSKNEIIYYAKYNENYSLDIYKYNINTNQKEKILDQITSFQLNNIYILYTKENSGNLDEILYVYNVKDKTNTIICESFRYSPTVFRALLHNDDIYYLNQTRLIRYNNGKNDILYSDDEEEMFGINIINDKIIEIIYLSGKTRFLVDEKITNETPSISVLMKNEQLKKFPLGITYEDEEISWEGKYGFYEFAEPDKNMLYDVQIYKKGSEYYANINIDGWMTALSMRANITEQNNEIALIFDKYIGDDNNSTVYKKGDILFSLKKEENVINTYWDKLKPMLLANKKNGKVYFTKE